MKTFLKNAESVIRFTAGTLIVLAGIFSIMATRHTPDRTAVIIRNQGAEMLHTSVANDCPSSQLSSTATGAMGAMARNSSGLIVGSIGDGLFRVNHETGETSLLVTITGLAVPSIRALAFDDDDNLFAVTKNPAIWDEPNKFYGIDVSTGIATFIGEMEYLGIQAMETGPDGTIYVWDMGGQPFWSMGLGHVNTATGVVTDINVNDGNDTGTNVKPDIQAMVYLNKLYGMGNGNIYEIDTVSGLATMRCFQAVGGDGYGAEFVYVEWP